MTVMLYMLSTFVVVGMLVLIFVFSKDRGIHKVLERLEQHHKSCEGEIVCTKNVGVSLCTRFYDCSCGWHAEYTSDAIGWL